MEPANRGSVMPSDPTTSATRYVDMRMDCGEANATEAGVRGLPGDLRRVGEGHLPVRDDERQRERRLQVRFIPAREGAAGIGRFEVGGDDDPLLILRRSDSVDR